jgi:hypothetical protein
MNWIIIHLCPKVPCLFSQGIFVSRNEASNEGVGLMKIRFKVHCGENVEMIEYIPDTLPHVFESRHTVTKSGSRYVSNPSYGVLIRLHFHLQTG